MPQRQPPAAAAAAPLLPAPRQAARRVAKQCQLPAASAPCRCRCCQGQRNSIPASQAPPHSARYEAAAAAAAKRHTTAASAAATPPPPPLPAATSTVAAKQHGGSGGGRTSSKRQPHIQIVKPIKAEVGGGWERKSACYLGRREEMILQMKILG